MGATPAPPSSPEMAKEQPATTPPQVASPSSPTPGSSSPEAKPELKPDEAVRRAEAKEAPSIDLEIYFDYKSAEVTPKAVAVLDTLGRGSGDLLAFAALGVPVLALVGGLAAACFAKVVGVVFLGAPRSDAAEPLPTSP